MVLEIIFSNKEMCSVNHTKKDFLIMFAHLIVLASVWVTRKRGNSSLVTGTQISDN